MKLIKNPICYNCNFEPEACPVEHEKGECRKEDKEILTFHCKDCPQTPDTCILNLGRPLEFICGGEVGKRDITGCKREKK